MKLFIIQRITLTSRRSLRLVLIWHKKKRTVHGLLILRRMLSVDIPVPETFGPIFGACTKKQCVYLPWLALKRGAGKVELNQKGCRISLDSLIMIALLICSSNRVYEILGNPHRLLF